MAETQRQYLAVHVPHFHVCNGRRPNGAFLQKEAWVVNDWVIESVSRLIETDKKIDTDE